MSSALLREVTEDERKAFLRDGVVCLRGIIAPEWVDTAREGIEELRRRPSPYATVVDKDPLFFYIDQMPSMHNEKLRSVALESGVARIAKQLIGAESMRWLYDQLFYKGAGPVAETPWHQDTAYGPFEGMNIVRIWMPVDPVPRETTIEVVRGSHLWNVVYATTEIKVLEDNKGHTATSKFDYLNKQEEGLPKVPDIEGSRESFEVIGHAVNPGDVVVFNYHVLHHAGSGMNPNSKRRALAILYADDKVSFKHRPNLVPGPVEHAGKTWHDGQVLADFPEVFPVV